MAEDRHMPSRIDGSLAGQLGVMESPAYADLKRKYLDVQTRCISDGKVPVAVVHEDGKPLFQFDGTTKPFLDAKIIMLWAMMDLPDASVLRVLEALTLCQCICTDERHPLIGEYPRFVIRFCRPKHPVSLPLDTLVAGCIALDLPAMHRHRHRHHHGERK